MFSFLVFSHTAAEIQILINPVYLPENMLPGTQPSRVYDKDVARKADVYRFLSKTKDFIIDVSKEFQHYLFILDF